jgi:hypothetical protein
MQMLIATGDASELGRSFVVRNGAKLGLEQLLIEGQTRPLAYV